MTDRVKTFLKKIPSRLKNMEFEAAIITSRSNRFYFSGLITSDGVIIITKDEAYFLVDFRYYELAAKTVKHLKVVLINDFLDSLKEIIKKHDIHSVLVESEDLVLSRFKKLKHSLKDLNVTLVDDNILNPAINELRAIKSEDEIEKIKTAQEISERAFNYILPKIKVGISEKSLALEIEYFMKKMGAVSTAFNIIVVSGENSSLPHGVPSDKTIEPGDFITIDMGANFEGYCSDMTRTVSVKSASSEQKSVYYTVLKAQNEAISLVKSGVKCSELDKKARNIIGNSKCGGVFGHALGHGVGIDVHEKPIISPKSSDILKTSMVVTIEPGIYINNKFGVRIEDMVKVEVDGCYNFTKIPKDLIIL